MIEQAFRIDPASWPADEAELRAVREEVFVLGQASPPDEEWDALDPRSQHVLARDADGRPIGTGRLVPPLDGEPASIGRMAVLEAWRGRGVGAAILRVLVEQARQRGHGVLELRAQCHAIPFYEQAGFAPFGEEFLECAIPHRRMRLELAADARPPTPAGARDEPLVLLADDRAQAMSAMLAVLADARHEVDLLTRDLDPLLLDTPTSLDAIKHVALSGRRAQVRIIVLEPRKALLAGHRLIPLAQRLPSAIALRTPVDERDLQYPSAFVLNDRRGYFFRPLGSRVEGEGSTGAPGRHAQLRALFDQLWERSEPASELRALA
jgi:predicted GNAT family N-acyltransferase